MTPTRQQLAEEMAARNERCGHVEDERICLRQREHQPPHQFEPIDRVIPIA